MTAKKAIWIIRAILYGSLAFAAVLLLARRDGESVDDAAPGTPITLLGRTGGNHYFSATAQDGRLFRISTFVELRCLDGNTRLPALTINAGRGGFPSEGDHVLVRAELPWTGDDAFTHHLRVDARRDGARLSGTVDDFVTRTGASGQVCSGRVAFSAHE